jgi:hypothetical protein
VQELAETGNLPAQLIGNPELLKQLVIDEIERALPKIISNLEMPQPLDNRTVNLLQYRLMAGRGFRPFTPAVRKKTVENLQHEKFLRTLRKIRKFTSNAVRANTDVQFRFQENALSESTNVSDVWITKSGDMTGIGLGTIKVSEPESTNILGKQPSVPFVREDTSASPPRDVLPYTLMESEKHGDHILEFSDTPIELQEPVAQRDIRGLLALFKNGRLITFVEPAARSLLPPGIEAIEVPTKKIYGSVSLENLMSEYHGLVVSDSADSSAQVSSELRLLDALLVSLENEAQWSRINKRRFHLITKKHSTGLEQTELDELDQLQRLADKQAESAHELPFAELAMLKDYARKLGFNESPLEQS